MFYIIKYILKGFIYLYLTSQSFSDHKMQTTKMKTSQKTKTINLTKKEATIIEKEAARSGKTPAQIIVELIHEKTRPAQQRDSEPDLVEQIPISIQFPKAFLVEITNYLSRVKTYRTLTISFSKH